MTKVGESLNDLQGRSTRQWYWLMMMGINYPVVGILIKLKIEIGLLLVSRFSRFPHPLRNSHGCRGERFPSPGRRPSPLGTGRTN